MGLGQMEGHLLLRPLLVGGKRQPPEKRRRSRINEEGDGRGSRSPTGKEAATLEDTRTETGKRRLPTNTAVGGHFAKSSGGVERLD
jgi:hypothetical protein